MSYDAERRRWMTLTGSAVLGAAASPVLLRAADEDEAKPEGKEVLAVEDMMREHGVLRRALLVYSEAASRLSRGQSDVPTEPLRRAAVLFRSFGEDYHERSLEEQHVFPILIKAGGQAASLSKTLKAQHDRGREITEYILTVCKGGAMSPANTAPFTRALNDFVRMYEHHAAIEDTIVFPAWKKALSAEQYEELSDQFEELEHKMFGRDGFEDAVKRIAAIEQAFGLSDLAALTAAPPPKPA